MGLNVDIMLPYILTTIGKLGGFPSHQACTLLPPPRGHIRNPIPLFKVMQNSACPSASPAMAANCGLKPNMVTKNACGRLMLPHGKSKKRRDGCMQEVQRKGEESCKALEYAVPIQLQRCLEETDYLDQGWPSRCS